MISRIWHGYTTRENADEYERLLKEEIFAGEDYALAVVPPKARLVLKRFDERSQHHEVRQRLRSCTQ